MDSIDILRGLLMVLIIAAHSQSTLEPLDQESLPATLLSWLLQIGTPGFVVTSGLLLGYFCVVRDDMTPILQKYFSRARNLVLIAHPLIALALYGPLHQQTDHGFLEFLLTRWYITDSLAVLFIVLAPLLQGLSPRTRCLAGAGALLVAQLLRVLVAPASLNAPFLLIYEIGVGVNLETTHVLTGIYPLLPLAGAFLIGSSIGDHYARRASRGGSRAIATVLFRYSGVLLALSVCLILAWVIARQGLLGFVYSPLVDFLYPDRFFTLFPMYLALVLTAFAVLILRSESPRGRGTLERFLEPLGRASLIVYVVQYYIVQTLPYLLGRWHHARASEAIVTLLIALPLLYEISNRWNRREVSSRLRH